MTPDRRLDQLEPIVAEVLQNTDRLIEGQGQLVDLTTKTKADVEQVKIGLDQVKTDLSQVDTNLGQVDTNLGQVQTDLGQVQIGLGQVKATGEITATGLAKLTINVNDLRAEMNQRFDDLRTEMNQRFNRSEQVQQEILTFLRERLS